MDVTDDIETFCARLQVGDVIAIDSLHVMISGLVQWADDAPVNHTILVLGPDQAIMANDPNPQDTSNPPGSAVQKVRIRDILALPKLHAATVLRPHDLIDAPDRQAAVVAVAQKLWERRAKFATLDMLLLGPSTLKRAYGSDDGSVQGILRRSILDALWLASQRELSRVPDDAATLFCAELVYRCLIGGGVEVTIDDPITIGSGLGGLAVDEQRPRDARRYGPDAEPAHLLWRWLAAHNHDLDVWQGFDQPSPVQPELVTPGDLWRSPSMDAVVTLVKAPPRPSSGS